MSELPWSYTEWVAAERASMGAAIGRIAQGALPVTREITDQLSDSAKEELKRAALVVAGNKLSRFDPMARVRAMIKYRRTALDEERRKKYLQEIEQLEAYERRAPK